MDQPSSFSDSSQGPIFYNQEVYSCERKGKIKKAPSRSLSPQTVQPNAEYKNLFTNPTIESSMIRNKPLVPELKESYERMLLYLEQLFRERFVKVKGVVHNLFNPFYKLHSGMSSEETINSYLLSNDETKKNLEIKKFKEVVESTLAAERELYIERLAHEVTILNEKVVTLEKGFSTEKVKACDELEVQNKKLRLQIMNLKKSTEELQNINENTLNELEEKNKIIEKLKKDNSSSSFNQEHLAERLQKENSILASQLREMQDEIAENCNMSRMQIKSLTSLEMANSMLSDQVKNLQSERDKLLNIVSDKEQDDKVEINKSQLHSNLQGIAKVMNKNAKLKESLTLKEKECENFQSEVSRLSQIISLKDKEITDIFTQHQDLQTRFSTELTQKDLFIQEKIKSIKHKNSKKIDKLKTTFENILNSKLGEIENEAVGQIREAKIKEEQAMKNLQERSESIKSDFMSIHEHEKIMNEKIQTFNKQKAIEVETLTEKFEQEFRHLKETFSLKTNNSKDKHQLKIQELNETIEKLSIELDSLREKDVELYQIKNDLRESQERQTTAEEKIYEAENEINEQQKIKDDQISALKEKNSKLKTMIKDLAKAGDDAQTLLSKEIEVLKGKIRSLEDKLKDEIHYSKTMKKEKLLQEQKNIELIQNCQEIDQKYKEALETLKEQMVAKSKEDEAIFKKVLDEKVAKSKLCEDTAKELQRLHELYTNQKSECENLKISLKDKNRVVDQKVQKMHSLSEALNASQRSLELHKKEAKNKRSRLQNAFKSAFSTLRAEIAAIKSNMRGEIDTLQKLMKNSMDGVIIKYNESLLKVTTAHSLENQEQQQKFQERVLQVKLAAKEEVNALEKQITEINYQHKEDINELENQHKIALENLKRHYNDKFSLQEKSIENYKQEVKKDFENKKSQNDTVLTRNVLQEIRRFESNMQTKSSEKPLTLSQLKPERLTSSTSNLRKIEQISKKLDSKIQDLKYDSFNCLSSSCSKFSPKRATFGNTKATLGFMSNPHLSKISCDKENHLNNFE
ncbi:unnamed protein product [Moneuplotes crassus]|uniref:Uncharacterized protein n=1 Tax=Euplotes crassus TaxID=5936 RepID=A0AAD2CW35_EUPCR|nr:unnamed protein product [Moneuplotes crassus]